MKINVFLKIILIILFFIPKASLAIDTNPTISASGNQTYCPGSYTKITSSGSVQLSDPNNVVNQIYIQISTGYISGQDKLILTNLLSHPAIGVDPFDTTTGKLRIYANGATVADFVAAIEDIVFYNSSTAPSGTRTFSITIGQANYLPRNKHFYEYVSYPGVKWKEARDAAALKVYYGLRGYLATLTSDDEAILAGVQAKGAGWIGASDDSSEGASEGDWKWVTGPEKGTSFWRGNGSGYRTPPYYYDFWNETGNDSSKWEPNNEGNENYAHILYNVGKKGSWNDLSNSGSTDPKSDYYPLGYIVEYGDLDPGDVNAIQISASTTITIPKITSTTSNSRCGSGSVTLKATATDGTINWYASSSGGTPLTTGETYSPVLTNTTTYYIDAGCSTSRIAIIATIINLPDAPVVISPVFYCQNEAPVALSATISPNSILNWYTVAIGGTSNATRPIPSTTTIGTTSYFVSQTNTATGCEGPRSEIKVTSNARPLAPVASDISYCQNETVIAALNATTSTNCTLNWYVSATGGTPSSSSPIPVTTTVGFSSYFVSQTSNITNCEGPRSEIKVTINARPSAPEVTAISYCKNETALPLSATAATNCILNWYTAATGGTSTTTNPVPSTTNQGSTSYFVSQTNSTTGCEGPRTELIVTVNALPVVVNITISQCDTDAIPDGKTLFNLRVNNSVISENYTEETFTYYNTQEGANNALASDLIVNDLSFENTTASTTVIWARVANNTTACHNVAEIILKVSATNIDPNYKFPLLVVCDDNLDLNGNDTSDNNKRDGITTFDMTASKAVIQNLLPTSDTYTINYYKNETDALAETNVITDISKYRNIGYPNSQDIWIRIDSDLDNACYGLGPYLTLIVEALPVANTVVIPRQCDDNNDGIFTFNTSSLESDLLQGQTNVTVTYFDQANNPLKDANGVLITSPFPVNFTSTSQTIKAVVTNNTTQQCFDETTITFIVDASPIANAVPSDLTTTCDDEANPINQDGKFVFETALYESIILGRQTGMIVKYYDQNGTLLASPLPNPFVTGSQKIIVSVENPLNSTCVATTTINFVVNPIPNIDLNLDGASNELVCSNLPSFFVTLNAGIRDNSDVNDYSYIWKKDGTDLDNNAPTLGVNTVGVFTVEVLNNAGCSRIRTITVNASNVATIDSIDIVDLTDSNTLTINTSGTGDYEYSLDDPNNFWQDSNFFDNVPAGIHEIFINDKNGCGIVSQTISVIGAPKFFTPNSDGYNDYWSIKGINDTFNSKSIIYIFDRYGKLLKQWVPNSSQGWDGTFNGTPLPTDDYWFTLKLEDGRETKGHFTLKR